jgi:uncharacterized membrane protein YfcA
MSQKHEELAMSLELILIFLLIGALAGLLSGLLGVGGGIIVVPSLAFLLTHYHLAPNHLTMQVAAATSLAAMIVTTAFSLRAHYHRAEVEFWSTFRLILPGIILGAVAGSFLAGVLNSNVLRVMFGIFMLFVALRLFLPERSHPSRTLPGFWGNTAAAILIGILSGILGIGGSVLFIPYFVYFNIPLRKIIVLVTASGFVIAVTGSIAFMLSGLHTKGMPTGSIGYVYWPAALGIAFASPWFATLGAMLSHRLPTKILRGIFAVFLLVVAIDMIY